MFRDACTRARDFTIPIVLSIQTVDGECAAGIGTAVVVNDEGWIVTAAHVLKQLDDAIAAETKTKLLQSQIAAIKNDQTLSAKERGKRLNAIGKPKRDDIMRWSVWAGDGVTINPGLAIEAMDIAIAKLQNFDGSHIKEYPVFKDPMKDFEPGASLCRMGFAFVDVKPVWNDTFGRFDLTQNVPVPIFPNEGILSRIGKYVILDPKTGQIAPTTPIPHSVIETSSAGILGQSGGPIFDQKGAIWGIQSNTTSYAFDLNTSVQQYYHVGVGVHAETVIAFLKAQNVKYQVSSY